MGFTSPQGQAPNSISAHLGSHLRPGMSCLLSMAGWVGGSLAGMTDSSRMWPSGAGVLREQKPGSAGE